MEKSRKIRKSAFAFFERAVALLDEPGVTSDEPLLRGGLGFVEVDQEGLEFVAGLMTEVAIAGLTEVFERLVSSFPSVAELVVLARVRPLRPTRRTQCRSRFSLVPAENAT